MKKLLSLLLAPLFLAVVSTPAFSAALSTYWDVNPYGITDGITEDFDRISYEADTTSVQYDSDGSGTLSVGDIFVDSGNAYATALQGSGANVDSDGLNLQIPAIDIYGYVFTFAWEDLTGFVYDINPGATTDAVVTRYTSGTITFWLDSILNGVPTLGAGFSTSDDMFIDRGDAQIVAEVEIIFGTGNITLDKAGNLLTGSYNLTGLFTLLTEDFWFEASTGDDLGPKYVEIGWLLGFTSGDTTDRRFTQTFSTDPNDGILWTIDSRHSSNFEIEVIPEPSTIVLLGAGLLGAGLYLRRKNRS